MLAYRYGDLWNVNMTPLSSQRVARITLYKLKLGLLAALVVPVLFFAVVALDERSQLLRSAEQDALSMSAVLREHALTVIDTSELLIRELDRRIQGMNWNEIRASSSALSAEMAAMHADMSSAASVIALADAVGRASTLAGSDVKSYSVANRELWSAQRDADRGTFISRPYIGTPTGRANFGISRRRTTPDGTFDGTVHIAVAVSYFTEFWTKAISHKDGAIVGLIRTDGEVLARLPTIPAWALLPPLVTQTSPLMSHIAAEPTGGVFRGVSPNDGVERILSYGKVGNYPLVVGYGVSVASVLATWWQHLLIGGGVGGLLVTSLVLTILSSMRQVRQLSNEQARRAEIEDAAKEGQRLELLGQLAAGVGHDFANIVQVVSGAATLIERVAGDADRVRPLARRLCEAADQGAALTQRMLDLVRRHGGERGADHNATTDPAEALSSAANLLSHIVGQKHRLRFNLDALALPPLIRGSRDELEAAVMNLAINSRDALPDGGEIVIRAETESIGAAVESADAENRRSDPMAGLYVRISVVDSGVGMAPEVLARASEAFFTTKPRGRGTGLGLASARGFAERAGGRLSIESRLGAGTTVTIWLPAIAPRGINDAIADCYTRGAKFVVIGDAVLYGSGDTPEAAWADAEKHYTADELEETECYDAAPEGSLHSIRVLDVGLGIRWVTIAAWRAGVLRGEIPRPVPKISE
jgi:signal transduction histidine kinase